MGAGLIEEDVAAGIVLASLLMPLGTRGLVAVPGCQCPLF